MPVASESASLTSRVKFYDPAGRFAAPGIRLNSSLGRSAAKAKGIEIDAPARPTVGPILADPNRVHQIVWNLLSIAIKFTPSGGTVRSLVTEHAELLVIDSGQGIEASFLPRVFDRFQQETSKPHTEVAPVA
jgi:signal transduction histidine kinase